MARAAKPKKEISMEEALWKSADKLRGSVEPAEYKHVVLSLFFLKFASDKFEECRNKIIATHGEKYADMKPFYTQENVFYLPEESRWKYIIENAKQDDIALKIDTALYTIEKNNPALKGALPDNYYSRLHIDTAKLASLLDEINRINTDDKENDIIGRVYEYFLSKFALAEGKGKGEFYTPKCIVNLIAEMLEPYDGILYDPCCGSGGMFVQSAKFIQAHSGNRGNISVYGQESNADTWKMAKMNMAIRGIDADFGQYHADTFFNDLHKTLKADFIMANPPFNLSNWGQDKLKDDIRWKYGVPPAGNANYAWIQHMIHHLAPNGKIGLVLANGALSTQSSGEGDIRKNIIEADLVEGIVSMPTQLFYSVTIPVTLWFITKGKKQKGKTLFVDARKMGYMVDRKHRDFTDEDIQKLADTFKAFQDGTLEEVKGFCAVADIQAIAAQDYILTPGRYVGIEEQEDDGEPFDEKMKRLTSELSDMFKKSHELENEIREKLGAIGYDI